MKHAVLSFLSILLLYGCVSVAFDNVEYDHYLSVAEAADSAQAQCGHSREPKLWLDPLSARVRHISAYSIGRESTRPDIAAAARELSDLNRELTTAYIRTTPSPAYCRIKLGLIATSARLIAAQLGRLS